MGDVGKEKQMQLPVSTFDISLGLLQSGNTMKNDLSIKRNLRVG